MKPPAFQFYASDFLIGTAMMSAEEVGAYMRLLCYQWDQGSVPDNISKICRLTGCSSEAASAVRMKFECKDGLLQNKRLELERQKQAEYRAAQSGNGKAGAAKRWHGDTNGTAIATPLATPMANGMAKNSSPSPSPSPSPVSIPDSRTKTVAGRVSRQAAALPDDVWLASLASDKAYSGISVETETAKCRRWCETNRQAFTRRRLVNWLNRSERPLSAHPQQSRAPSTKADHEAMPWGEHAL